MRQFRKDSVDKIVPGLAVVYCFLGQRAEKSEIFLEILDVAGIADVPVARDKGGGEAGSGARRDRLDVRERTNPGARRRVNEVWVAFCAKKDHHKTRRLRLG